MSRQSGPNTGFEFGWRYERIKLLEHHKRLNILKADGSSVFCFMFSLDKHAFFKGDFYFYVQHSLSTDFRIRIIPFLVKFFIFNCF